MAHSSTLPAELTIYHVAGLRGDLLPLLAQGAGELTLDLSEVTEIDGAGVQLLLTLERSAGQQGRKVRFARPSQPVSDVFALLGLGTRLEGQP